jgi:hypothetical protein
MPTRPAAQPHRHRAGLEVGLDDVRAGTQPLLPPQKSQKPHMEFDKLQFAGNGVIPSESSTARIYIRYVPGRQA